MTLLLLAWLGCADAPRPGADAPPARPSATDPLAAVAPLDAPRLLRRISLDLRGVVPTVAELDTVEADPTQVDVLRDAWLDDPRLEQRLVEMLAEQWQTRIDEFDARWYDYPLTARDEFTFDQSVGEEPLRLMARVAMEDRPWSDTVTSDETMVNPMLLSIWPVEAIEDGDGWRAGRYTDGRPAAGVLTTNGLWWRYSSSPFNLGRSRAAAMLKHLLCEDFLARSVSFAPAEATTTESGTANAALGEPYCMACHAAIEPLAATTFGFWWRTQYSAIEMSTYHAEREPLGPEALDVVPAYFGARVNGLADLGAHVAADPHFHRCAVETAGAMLLRRPLTPADHDRVDLWLADYHAAGDRYKVALRAITDDPLYRAGAVADDAPDALHARARTERLLSVDQMQSSLEDLAGFRWSFAGFDQLGVDTVGYRVLGGGVDGQTVVRPQPEPNLTWALVVERLAQASAWSLVRQELEGAGDGGEAPARLLAGVTPDSRPGDADFRDALRGLHWRLYAVRADDGWVDAVEALWGEALVREGSPAGAWRVVLSALLRDPLWVST
jgi:hypothetical protein